MLIVISPAKKLDWSARDGAMTTPDFIAEANSLARTMRNLSLRDLRGLMSLSDDLARLNRDRFRAFADAPEAETLRPAALAFAGDTYQGLRAGDFSAEEMAAAQARLRILSGLYGVLRPLDGIQPYRLEMGSRLKTRRGATLYDFWRDLPARTLRQQADQIGTDTLVNCASQEYFGAVDLRRLGLNVITPVFLEAEGDSAKMISFFAKRARGAMARWLIVNRVTTPADLIGFDLDGYGFDAARSEPGRLAFVRARRAVA
ncbi:peroxide stress protein YaaA [Pseudooceanicola sp.]|uniref:peroxide stress protein YaaA n=1 Tax=Pseudooceanicola sp. TaxID=1914328 RepID=UPI00260D062A|nr:peroxide stress protein YaaA [Pseudooceanicola sp.]MDF1855351.1 peroxide stress protein YaaA [Pseudooceanicola sp.]